ncbi:hypothetical protein skT53_20650 [Effusibacillus dendaii]|uniref:Succinylglutamate desuccinylase/Aspartoacylase catalytic domain-containing protein n=2 Tax=Effusibacillus dendaii TaxID=2743772 RepID=A0A7I8DEU7_9BACL|nr:hypothetical protein skT53_20650 [Effusibacillus dendaii]
MRIMKHRLAIGTPFETDYYVLRGSMKGPVCMITAGIHGTEIAGVLAAQKLQTIPVKKGVLILVPMVNVLAYRRRTRGYAGCPDLNRTFPYKDVRKSSHPLAANLFQLTMRFRPEFCIDLHEANGFSRLDNKKLGQSLICYPGSVNLATRVTQRINRSIVRSARRFTVRQGILRGSFRTAVGQLLGCRAITVETSINLPLSVRIRYQMDIVRNLLREAGLL